MAMINVDGDQVLDVSQVLSNNESQKGNTIQIEAPTIDAGNMCIFSYEQPPNVAVIDTVTRLTQVLVSKIFQLPIVDSSLGPLVTLPKPKTIIPREKPVPVEPPMTRWEKFAKKRGIKKSKTSKVWHEATQTWRHKWGKDGIKNDKEWLIECNDPSKLEGHRDPFIKKSMEKKKRVEKQKRQEAVNKRSALASETKDLVGSGSSAMVIGSMAPTAKGMSRKRLDLAIRLAQGSTRSLGNYDTERSDEPAKKKRQVLPSDRTEEKKNSNRIVNRMLRVSQEGKEFNRGKMANQIIQQDKKEAHSQMDSYRGSSGKGGKRRSARK